MMLGVRSRWSLLGASLVTASLLSPLGALAGGDGRAWQVVPSASPDTTSLLSGVAVAAPRQVWAVGSSSAAEFGAPVRTLIELGDRTGFAAVPSPSPGVSSSLSGVAAVAPDDVWAVGSSDAATLIEHWDGASWSVVPSPGSGSLAGVTALSATDAWAVGSNAAATLVEHWNGQAWSVVPSPGPGSLSSVDAVSRNNVWAVGNNGAVTLVEHWDGTSWTVVASPSPGAFSGLSGVSAVSRTDVWAVGGSGGGTTFGSLIEHWDGTSWTVVPAPSPGTLSSLLGVFALDHHDAWAVGDANTDPASPFSAQTLTEHWDGTSWTVVPSPTQHTGSFLHGVASGWAVGSSHDVATGADFTLAERYERARPAGSPSASSESSP